MSQARRVFILRKRLTAAPVVDVEPAVSISPCRVPDDMAAWLALRERAFTDEVPPVRPWSEADFLRELVAADGTLRRPTWLARPREAAPGPACGAISLSLPRSRDAVAALHWLMVDPDWRRRGVGTRLLETAERHCWDLGWRELRLETHHGWDAALKFYAHHGFR